MPHSVHGSVPPDDLERARRAGAASHGAASHGAASHQGVPAEVAGAMVDPRRRIGRYWVVAELGKGGMGRVLKAWDAPLARWVALKLVHDATDAKARAYFLREARTAAQLQHPNIAAIYEVGEDEQGREFIAMQFVAGSDLSGGAGRRLGQTEVVRVMTDVSRAVAAAHEQRIVHRDLKPHNLIVDDADGRVFVLDFGLAKQTGGGAAEDLGGLTASGAIMGTPYYMAPEQAAGEVDEIDAVSDVYGLGACLYELLTGKPPVTGSSYTEIIVAVIQRDPVPPRRIVPTIPRDLETIVCKALAKEKGQRYPSAAALADDLERFARGEPIVARPASLVYRLKLRVRRDRRFAAAIGVIALLLVAGALLVPWALGRAAEARREAEAIADAAVRRADAVAAIDRARERYDAGDGAAALVAAKLAQTLAPDLVGGAYWEARCRIRRYAEERALPEPWMADGVLVLRPAPPEFDAARRDRERAVALIASLRAADEAGGLAAWELDAALGMVAVLEGSHARGIDLLDRALGDADPSASLALEARAYRARALYLEGRFDEASASDGGAALRLPAWFEVASLALQGVAVEAQVAGRTDEALVKYQEAASYADLALGDTPRGRLLRASVSVARGKLLLDIGRVDEAARELEAAVEIADAIVDAADGALLVRALERRAQARRVHARFLVQQAGIAEGVALLRAAVDDLDRAAQLAPDDPTVRLQRGLALASLAQHVDHDRKAGIRDRALAELADFEENGRAFLARLRLSNIGHEERIGLLESLLQRFPQDRPLRAERVSIAGEWAEWTWNQRREDPEARFREALAMADRLVADFPGWAPAWQTRGDVRAMVGDWHMIHGRDPTEDYALVFEDIERALAINPRLRDAHQKRSEKGLSLGGYLVGQGRVEEGIAAWKAAIEAGRRAIEISPQHGHVHYTLAMVHLNIAQLRERSDPEAALVEYGRGLRMCEEARAVEPPGSPARRESAFIGLAYGFTLARKGRNEEAVKAIRDAVAALDACLEGTDETLHVQTHFLEILRARAQGRCALGKHAEAREDWSRAGPGGASMDDAIRACVEQHGR